MSRGTNLQFVENKIIECVDIEKHKRKTHLLHLDGEKTFCRLRLSNLRGDWIELEEIPIIEGDDINVGCVSCIREAKRWAR